jgi:DNA invertase Pin-like site-specific DNA recombinase
MNRPGLRALMRQIEAGDVKVVLIYKLERMSRNMDEWGPFRAFLKKHGCRLESATEDISESEPEGRLKNNIVMSVAEFERLNTAKKTRVKMHEQAKRGIWNGGMVPLGYSYDLNTKQLAPNPAEAALVRRVFEQAAQLVPLTDIANALNAQGHRTKPRTFLRRDGTTQQVGGNHFRSDGLRLIITNPIYRGCVRFAGTEFAGKHEGLIAADLWERANAVVTKLPPRERPPVVVDQDKHLHLLKGVVHCGHCRRALIPHDSGKKDPTGRPYRYYDCGQVVRKTRDEPCPVGRIAAGALESVVIGFLTELGRHPELTRAALTDTRSSQRVDRGPLRAAVTETDKSLADVDRQLSNCVDAIAAGGADMLGDELRQRVFALREKRQELVVRREQLRQDLRAFDEAAIDEKRVLTAMSRLGASLPRLEPAEQKQLAGLMVERIDVKALRPTEDGMAHRPLQFEIKLSLPRLVEGMEERVIVDQDDCPRVLPRQRSLAFRMKVAVGSQGAGAGSVILTPFEHRVSSSPAKRIAAAAESVRHCIHRALSWQRELQRDPTLEKQAIAARQNIAPGSVTHHLKLLNLAPEIQEYLRELKDPDAVRHFSLRKMRRLSELPLDNQTTQFKRLRQSFGAGMSIG